MRSKLLLLIVRGQPSMLCGQNAGQAPPQAVERIAKEVRHEIFMFLYYRVVDDIRFSIFQEAE